MPSNLRRGTSEQNDQKPSAYKKDVKYLLQNKSWLMVTAAFITFSFSYGGLAVWLAEFGAIRAVENLKNRLLIA